MNRMTIRLLNAPSAAGHPFVAAVMACYILRGGRLRVVGASGCCAKSTPSTYILLDVEDWVDWLRVVCSAFAELSRLSYPHVMRMRHPVHVVGFDEMFFVMFDEETKGVRYGSL